MSDLFIVAMGGNSLLDPALPPTVENQFRVTAEAIKPVAELMRRGERLVLTHGNGPQVGFMQLRSELSKGQIHEVPLDSLDADTQGAIGYMIERTLREELLRLKADTDIAAIVTEVEVDPKDPAFEKPTKPVGRFYSAAEAETLMRDRGWRMVEDAGRGHRRVVPSPQPQRVVQLGVIRKLIDAGVTVITCGGGGIPVMRDGENHIRGLEAVIDKDRATAMLAIALKLERMFITTGVDAIYADWRKPELRRALRETTVSELSALAAKGEFPPGSMGPKVEAAIDFLKHGGKEVVICKPEALVEAFEGRAGTRIRPG